MTEQAARKSVQSRARKRTAAEIAASAAPFFMRIGCNSSEIPEYWSPSRDGWLREHWRTEPFLAGTVFTLTSKQATLKYNFRGGRNGVAAARRVFTASDFGAGFSTMMIRVGQDYYTQDNGLFLEICRDGDRPTSKVVGLAHLDSGRCTRTGDAEFPVVYRDTNGQAHKLAYYQVIALAPMASPEETRNGVGFCYYSRALSATEIMRQLWTHKAESLSDLPPAAILLLNNISQKRWDDVVKRYEAGQVRQGNTVWRDILVLLGVDPDAKMSAEFLSFSHLWAGFDEGMWTQIYMNLLALCAGVSPREFWPGSVTGETKADAEAMGIAGRTKGPGELALALQRAFNAEDSRVLPIGVEFYWDYQDEQEAQAEAELRDLQAETLMRLWQPAGALDGPPVSRDELRRLLSDAGILPPEMLLESGQAVDQVVEEEPETLRQVARRRRAVDADAVLYDGGTWTITQADVDRAIADGRKRLGAEYAELLEAEPITDEERAELETVPWEEDR